MTHEWQNHPKNARFLELMGHKDALVDTQSAPNNKGYLWQYKKKYGFAATIDMAKDWVETMAEHYSIPASQRWISI